MSPGIKALKRFRLVFKLYKRKKNIQKIWKLSLKVMAEREEVVIPVEERLIVELYSK